MPESAVVLAHGLLEAIFAKTTHGLVRGPSRFKIAGVVDPVHAGHDAGTLLDGTPRGIPVCRCVGDVMDVADTKPTHCIVGVATVGGVLPEEIREGLLEAAAAGMTLVNGLHHLLGDDIGLVEATRVGGGSILDLRQPRPVGDLRFWTGEVLSVEVPRIAVLGTDCAIGKRTTCLLLENELRALGLRAEIVYTGQTGWLQGLDHGFILDATPNDFVCGELERAIVDCARVSDPDVILLEGQSGLRNPAGPCGSELIVSGAAVGVVLQHAPGREFFEGTEEIGCPMPGLHSEIELITLLGSRVLGVGIHSDGLAPEELSAELNRLRGELEMPVVDPLGEGVGKIAAAIRDVIEQGASG